MDFDFNFLKNNTNYFTMSLSYFESCKILLKEFEKISREDLLYPFLFNLRQYVELKLKEIIYIQNDAKCIKNESVNTHDLIELYNKMFNNLEINFDKKSKTYIKTVEKFIKLLDGLDKKSDSFRYPYDTKGNKININFNLTKKYIDKKFIGPNELKYILSELFDKLEYISICYKNMTESVTN